MIEAQTTSSTSSQASSDAEHDLLTRVFNSAILSTRTETTHDYPKELYALVDSPAYRAILSSVKFLSADQGLDERASAELIIKTFRKMDRLWLDYTLREGLERLRGGAPSA